MHKGISLIELVIIIFVIALVSVPFARLNKIIYGDIPKSYRMIESNRNVIIAHKQISKDVNAAKEFPKTFKGYIANSQTLLIELEKDTICYQMEEQKIKRRILANAGAADNEEIVSWPVPGAKIEWRVLQEGNKGYAVEVRTCIENKRGGYIEEKLANSYLYFKGAYQKAAR